MSEERTLGHQLKDISLLMKPHLDGVIHGLACELLLNRAYVYEIRREKEGIKVKQKWVVKDGEVEEKTARLFGVTYEDGKFVSKSGRTIHPLLA